MPPLFLWSILRLHWGFIVRQLGASAAQLAYTLPPPPTVVGSFMNPAARRLGLGESLDPGAGPAGARALGCALKATLAAGAGLTPQGRGARVGVVVFAEPSRITAAAYKTGGDYRNALKEPPYLAAARLLPVQAEGAASAPGASLAIAWIVDPDALAACLDLPVDSVVGALSAAPWAVYRLGSREGVASVVEAGAVGWEGVEHASEGSDFESILYQPVDCATPAGRAVRVHLYDREYRESAFHAPAELGGPSGIAPPTAPARFRVRGGCKAAWPRGRRMLALAYRAGGGVV